MKDTHIHGVVHGFSLIETMITLAIVAILASVAYPSYQQYVIRSNRTDALQFMLDVANREEENLLNKLNNPTYTDLAGLNISIPTRLQGFYTITASSTTSCNGVTLTAPAFCITATPVSSSIQKNDGTLTLDSQGNKKPTDKWK